MKKTIAALAFVLMAFGFSPVHANEPAAPGQLTNCHKYDEHNGYVYVGEPITIDLGAELMTLEEWSCLHNGIRLTKIKGNTNQEVKYLRNMAAQDSSERYPILLCRTGRTRGYALDLRKFYSAGVDHLNKSERRYYRSFVTRYAEIHNCELHANPANYREGS